MQQEVSKELMRELVNIKINELASVVMSGELLESFLRLPLIARVVCIAVIAEKGGEVEVLNFCKFAQQYV